MKHTGASEADPNPVDKTDPAGTPALDATGPVVHADAPHEADLEEEEVVRLFRALERQPRRPAPMVEERPSSDGGAFVAYAGPERAPAPAASRGEEREQVLVEFAALAGIPYRTRGAIDEGALGSGGLADTHVLPGRRRRRADVYFFLVSAVAVVGAAGAIGLARPRSVPTGTTGGPIAVDPPHRSSDRTAPGPVQPNPIRVETAWLPGPTASASAAPLALATASTTHPRAPSRSESRPAPAPAPAPAPIRVPAPASAAPAPAPNPEFLLLPDHP